MENNNMKVQDNNYNSQGQYNIPQNYNQPVDKKYENELLKEKIKLEKELQKEIKVKEKAQKDFNKSQNKTTNKFWKITTALFGISTLLMGFGIVKYGPTSYGSLVYSLLGALLVSTALIILFIFLAKKTHAILEFKSILSGNPLCLFFTDNKRVIWKTIKPEGDMIIDKNFGAFLANKNGSYIDSKTKNILMAFNSSLGTNASIESYALSDGLSKVIRDEKTMNNMRLMIMQGELKGDDIIYDNNGDQITFKPFEKLKESIDFSHLKSLMNTIIPHAINAQIEMKVQQRLSNFGKVDMKQIVLIFLAVFGAVLLAVVILKMLGVGNSSGAVTAASSVVKAAAPAGTIGG